ncbi:MAG TPA: hypothetical protein VD866_23985, partial [Urbifossiella sp.]|nr:hypothetical protein [Urbifossiella sp.]
EYPTDVGEAERWDPMLFTGFQKGYYESMRAATGPDGLRVSLGARLPEGGLLHGVGPALVKAGPGRPKVVGLFSH